MKKADFHVHTNYSDGVFSPEKIVDTAIDAGLEAIALTDHDNILSYEIAQNYLKNLGKQDKLEIIQGVEVNTLYKNYEVHILGYFMNTENEDFKKLLKIQQQARMHKNCTGHSAQIARGKRCAFTAPHSVPLWRSPPKGPPVWSHPCGRCYWQRHRNSPARRRRAGSPGGDRRKRWGPARRCACAGPARCC